MLAFALRLWAIIKFAFDLRESSLEQAIVNGVVLEIQPHLQSPVLGALAQSNVNFIIAQSLKLHGTKIGIRGNHDGSPSKMQKIGFVIVLESAFIKIGHHNVELIHIPSHEPLSHFQLHGHVHEKWPDKLVGYKLNLSVEVWDYKPVSEATIISILDTAEAKKNRR